jgi:hypothetical protein
MKPPRDGGDERSSRSIEVFLDDYHRFVVEAVGAEWEPLAGGRWVQLIVLPSFDPEIVFTAVEVDGTCRVVANTAQTNLWYQTAYSRDPDRGSPGERTPPPPNPVSVEYIVAGDHTDQFWSKVAAVQPRELMGLDGMTIRVRARVGTEMTDVETWAPPARSAVGTLYGILVSSLPVPDDHPVATVAQAAVRYFQWSA